MNKKLDNLRETNNPPKVIRVRASVTIDDILRHTDPAPDEETERFVAAIYADRRDAASLPR